MNDASQSDALPSPGSPGARRAASRPLALGLVLLAGIMEVLYLVVLRLGNLKEEVETLILLMFLQGILYFVSIHVAEKIPPTRSWFLFVFLAAAAFRATLFPLYPSLSDDPFRYRWEGKAQQAGYNPYRVRPLDPEVAFLRDETFPALPGPSFSTLYGPLLEEVFWISALITDRILPLKLPFLLCDLGVVVLLFRLLPLLGISPLRAVIYAWSPLAVVEFGASGHNDSLSIFAFVLALFWFHQRREKLSLAALSASALAKLYAVFLLPVFLLRTRWKLVWVPAILAAAVMAPYAGAWKEWTQTLSSYSRNWRNNESLYFLLRELTRSDPLAWRIYFLIVAAAVLYCLVRKVSPERACFLILGTVLLCSPNVFPWYVTWMVPLLAIYPNPAWLLLTITVFLSYHVLIPYRSLGLWREEPVFQVLEYVPFYGLLLGSWLVRQWSSEPQGREQAGPSLHSG